MTATSWPDSPLRHTYAVTTRDCGFVTACRLMRGTMPYAAMRFAALLATLVASLIWLGASIDLARWLTQRFGSMSGGLWAAGALLGYGALWQRFLRPALHMVECGHLAVLTELLTSGRVGGDGAAMFFHGRRIVLLRLSDMHKLLALRARLRAILGNFHRSLDWAAELVPLPGPTGADLMLNAVGVYLDKAVLSYNLARQDSDTWRASKDGLIYYCQNAKPILRSALRIVLLDVMSSFALWLLMLLPAALVLAPWHDSAVALTALLLAASLRAAFIKPVFLAMILVRYHDMAEGQVINTLWHERLAQVSPMFHGERV